jgi:hypothetical protein
VVLTGADLYTSYCMYSVIALLHRRCSIMDLFKTLFVSFFGNLAGALFFMAVLTGCKFPTPSMTSNTNLETQTVAHSRVVRIKMKLLLSQKPNALLHNGIRSSSRGFSVSPFTNPFSFISIHELIPSSPRQLARLHGCLPRCFLPRNNLQNCLHLVSRNVLRRPRN